MKLNWKTVKPILKVTGKVLLMAGGVITAVAAIVLANQEDREGNAEHDAKSPKYIVQMVNAYTREVIETCDGDDEVFGTYEDAALYASECSGNFGVGAETSEDRGEVYTDPDDVEFVVTEIDI